MKLSEIELERMKMILARADNLCCDVSYGVNLNFCEGCSGVCTSHCADYCSSRCSTSCGGACRDYCDGSGRSCANSHYR